MDIDRIVSLMYSPLCRVVVPLTLINPGGRQQMGKEKVYSKRNKYKVN